MEQERLTLRAVIVPTGVDPRPYLLQAGIVSPVVVPIAQAPHDAAGGAPDGWLSAVPAKLTLDRSATIQSEPAMASTATIEEDVAGPDQADPERRTVNLPDAFGMRPLAPVWRQT